MAETIFGKRMRCEDEGERSLRPTLQAITRWHSLKMFWLHFYRGLSFYPALHTAPGVDSCRARGQRCTETGLYEQSKYIRCYQNVKKGERWNSLQYCHVSEICFQMLCRIQVKEVQEMCSDSWHHDCDTRVLSKHFWGWAASCSTAGWIGSQLP